MGDGKMYIVGQKKNKDLIDNGNLDNTSFIIIKGPSNFGKTYLAKYIANHYNMTYVLLDNKVNTIRDLISISDRNNNCLYHFKDFEKSSPAAKAALLKIAEETPRGIKIVVTTSAYNLLQTLISRAYVISMIPYNNQDIEEYGNNLGIDNLIINRLEESHLEITPSLLFKLKQNEDIMEILDLVDETIKGINSKLTLEDISRISSKFWKDDKENVQLYLDVLSKCSYKLTKDYFWVIQKIEETKFILNKIAISNYRNLIHNMLMELV